MTQSNTFTSAELVIDNLNHRLPERSLKVQSTSFGISEEDCPIYSPSSDLPMNSLEQQRQSCADLTELVGSELSIILRKISAGHVLYEEDIVVLRQKRKKLAMEKLFCSVDEEEMAMLKNSISLLDDILDKVHVEDVPRSIEIGCNVHGSCCSREDHPATSNGSSLEMDAPDLSSISDVETRRSDEGDIRFTATSKPGKTPDCLFVAPHCLDDSRVSVKQQAGRTEGRSHTTKPKEGTVQKNIGNGLKTVLAGLSPIICKGICIPSSEPRCILGLFRGKAPRAVYRHQSRKKTGALFCCFPGSPQ